MSAIAALAIGVSGRPATAASTPLILLYASSRGHADDVRAVIGVRQHVRDSGALQVLTYDPESSAVKRAAAENHHPSWLSGSLSSDDDRVALAQAMGAQFAVVVAASKHKGSVDVHLLETATSARHWDFSDQSTSDASDALVTQVTDAIAHQSNSIPPATPAQPLATAPVTPAPLPATTIVTPAPLPATTIVTPAPLPAATIVTPAPPPAATIVTPAPPPAATAVTPAPLPAATAITPPVVVAPSAVTDTPPVAAVPATPEASPDTAASTEADLAQAGTVTHRGDSALSQGDFATAIALYRSAINIAPLSAGPRIKLAKAYLAAGFEDKAVNEGRRALEIDPNSADVQNFLIEQDPKNGAREVAISQFSAKIAKDPNDVAAHIGLGDAYLNGGSPAKAEAEYLEAKRVAPAGSTAAIGHLAQYYASQGRYEECLAELTAAGEDAGYTVAVRIVQSKATALTNAISTARDDFQARKTTREEFYETAKKLSGQSQNLSDFVAKIAPPAKFKISYLHRTLAANLLAEQAAVLVGYIETGDSGEADKIDELDKSAQTEMLTAHAAEKKLGLWKE